MNISHISIAKNKLYVYDYDYIMFSIGINSISRFLYAFIYYNIRQNKKG